MTIQEKILLAEREVRTAQLMLNSSRKSVEEWEQLLDLRSGTLNALKEEAKPPTSRRAKQ